MSHDPAFAAGLLIKTHGTEKALALCDQNIAACARLSGDEALAGAAQWKQIKSEVIRLNQPGGTV